MSWEDRRFFRNIAVMAVGTVGAHGVTIAFAPLITRLYGPDAFGLFGTFNALSAVLVPIAALTLPIAIVLPKSDSEAAAVGWLSAIVSLGTAIAMTVAFYFGGSMLAAKLSINSIGGYLMLLPLVMFVTAIAQIFRQWLIRVNRFHAIARVGVFHALIVNIAMVFIGLLFPAAVVLIMIAVAGHVLYAFMLSLPVKEYKKRKDSVGYYQVLRRYRDFPLYRAPQDLINAISQSMPVLLLASLFGVEPAGLYALGKVVMGAPSAMVGTAIRDVFYPKVTRVAQQGGRIDRLIIRTTVGLSALGIVPFALVVAFGPQLFSLVFGSEWNIAGEYARWLAPFFFFNFINKPSVAAVPVLRLQRGLLVYEILSTAGKLLGLIAGYHFFRDDVSAVALFSMSGVLAYSAMIVWIIQMARLRGGNETGAG